MKIIHLTDTHLGAGTAGFQQQPRQMDRLDEIFQALKHFIRSNGVELVIHSGDLTNAGNGAQIRQAVEQLKMLEVPVAFCLGNHDLAQIDSFELWQSVPLPNHFSPADTLLPLNEKVDLILINNTWWNGAAFGMHWEANGEPYSSLSEQTLNRLTQTLQAAPEKVAIIVVHAPLNAIPPRLTGMPESIHLPTANYKQKTDDLLSCFPRVKLVLTGHNHVNFAVRAEGNQFRLSTASLVEPPFEFRLIELSEKSLTIKTLPALPTSRHIPYHADKAWVNGQPEDRTLEITWN
jgi:DNA repair exonuclease SbcCD nuclease subunit